MLASLFYTRVAAGESTEGEIKKKILPGKCMSNAKKPEEPTSSAQDSARTSSVSPTEKSSYTEQHRTSLSEKLISSADVFGIGGETNEAPVMNTTYKRRPSMSRETAFQKIKPLVHGWLVRKRIRSPLGNVLIVQIIETKKHNRNENESGMQGEHNRAQRAFYVSRLVSFLENGISAIKLDAQEKKHDRKPQRMLTRPGYQIETSSSRANNDGRVELQLYSSDRALQNKEETLSSLQESVGMKGLSSTKLLKNITPTFLSERRSMFLCTIFSVEDYNEHVIQIPRFIMGQEWYLLSADRSFASLFGGEYHKVLDNANHISAALQ